MSQGGRVRVYDGRKVQEMLSGSRQHSVPHFSQSLSSPPRSVALHTGEDGMLTARSRARSVKMQAAREKAKRASRHELYLRQQVEQQKHAQAKIQERIVAERRKQDAQFEATYRELVAGRALTGQVDKLLELQDTADRQKKEQMFAEWEEKVFNPITKSITRQIDAVGHDTLSRLRREEYDKFLKATNGKQGLFLDIVLENDYDPFVPNARRIKSDCGKIHDPVKRVLSKAEEEKGMVDRSKFAKAKKPGRETLDVKQWHTGKIEATPHGHFAMMMAEHAGGTTEKAAKLTKSTVTFDHFDVAVGNDVIRSEFPRGKRPQSTIRSMVAAGKK